MDWGNAASGAASGALTGASFGPLGAAIGGVAGGLLGGFSTPNKQEEYHDPFQVTMNSEIQRLLSSDLGAKTAQMQVAGEKQGANDAFQQYAANPEFAKNPALMAAAYNKLQGGAQSRGIESTLAGASIDQRSRQQGLQLQNEEANRSFDIGKYNAGIDSQNRQPGAFESMLTNLIGTGAGAGLGKLLSGGNGSDPSVAGSQTGPLFGPTDIGSSRSNLSFILNGLSGSSFGPQLHLSQ